MRKSFTRTVRLVILTAAFAAPARAQDVPVTTLRKTPLYQGASATSGVVDTIPAGETVTLRGAASGRFIPVRWETRIGYVRLADVSFGVSVSKGEAAAMPRVDTVYVTRVRTDTITMVERTPDLPVPVPFDPPPSPSFKFFPVGDFTAILIEDMVYKIGRSNEQIVVPAGFVTDFASIPRALWSYLPPTGDYKLAAVVHDYLYWTQPCTKDQADNLFAIAMAEQGVPTVSRAVVYGGVVAAGFASWEGNRKQRGDSVPRFLTPPQRAIPNVSWVNYRRTLMSRGVRGDPNPLRPVPSYCALGNSTKVP